MRADAEEEAQSSETEDVDLVFLSDARAVIFFSPIALADVASDDLIRRPRQRMCPAGSGFGQLRRWEWIWTLLKR